MPVVQVVEGSEGKSLPVVVEPDVMCAHTSLAQARKTSQKAEVNTHVQADNGERYWRNMTRSHLKYLGSQQEEAKARSSGSTEHFFYWDDRNLEEELMTPEVYALAYVIGLSVNSTTCRFLTSLGKAAASSFHQPCCSAKLLSRGKGG